MRTSACAYYLKFASQQIPRALKNVRSVVKMDANNLHYLHLLALLLSAQKKVTFSLDVCRLLLTKYFGKVKQILGLTLETPEIVTSILPTCHKETAGNELRELIV